MPPTDLCPSRDDAQPHLYDGGYCTLCGTPKPTTGPTGPTLSTLCTCDHPKEAHRMTRSGEEKCSAPGCSCVDFEGA